jgi:hypothetical protein
VNDIYVVCDCGGGTVVSWLSCCVTLLTVKDVITYKVSSISPFEFGECIEGDGEINTILCVGF